MKQYYTAKERIKYGIEKYRNELLLLLIWIISIAIVNPIGNFPLNDDWAYGLDVYHLSEEGKLILSDWPAMTLIAQVLWGAIVTYIFGFSFTVLRFSTLFIGFLSIITFYRILINSGINKRNSFWGTLLFLFLPLFFTSAFTFMTEVYFLFTFNLTLLYLFKFYKSEQKKYLVLGTLFGLITTLIRQPGILTVLVFTAVYLLYKKVTKKNLLISILPTIIVLMGYLSYTYWLKHHFPTPNYKGVDTLVKQLLETPFSYYYNRLGLIAMYLGFISMPLLILILPNVIMKYRWYEKIFILLLFSIPLFIGTFLNEFPSGNVIYNLGLGPRLLKDGAWRDNIHPMISESGMNLIRLITLFSAAIVVTHFFKQAVIIIRQILAKQQSTTLFIKSLFLSSFILYLVFVSLNPVFFDRYTLPLFSSFFLILLPIELIEKRPRILLGIAVILYGLLNIAATRDYLSWNRARWSAIDYLTNEKKIEKTEIDGGFEFNSWFQTGPFNPVDKNSISWWFVMSDDYVLSLGNIDGFKRIDVVKYTRMFPPGIDSICILKKREKDFTFYSTIRCDCEIKNENNTLFISDNKEFEFMGGNQQSREEALSGEFSIKLDKQNPYGLLSKYTKVKSGDQYIITTWRKSPTNKAGIVVSIGTNNEFYFFNPIPTGINNSGWKKIISKIVVPEGCNDKIMDIYLWNTGEEDAWFDDLEITKCNNTVQN